jgi:hypothetical protein
MRLPGLKARTLTPLLLECTACGVEAAIPPQRSLRTFAKWLNQFKRKHNCCSVSKAIRAARRKRLN